MKGFRSLTCIGLSLNGIRRPCTVCVTHESFVIFCHSFKQCLIFPALKVLTLSEVVFSTFSSGCNRCCCTLAAGGVDPSRVVVVETPSSVYRVADSGGLELVAVVAGIDATMVVDFVVAELLAGCTGEFAEEGTRVRPRVFLSPILVLKLVLILVVGLIVGVLSL